VSYRREVSKPQVAAPARFLPPAGTDRTPQGRLLHGAFSALIVVLGALTIRPIGWSGRGLLVAVLLVVNCLFLVSRHTPDSILPSSARFVVLSLGVIAAAALLAVGEQGTAYLFAFFLTGQAGYRLNLGPAVLIAVASSALCGGVLLYQVGTTDNTWTVGATTGLAVLIGITSRSQKNALDSAIMAAEAAERAVEAEAGNAVLAERSRIARDVHDVLAHSLAGINMQLELADALLDTGDLERVRQATGKAQDLVQESLKQAQWTVRALREDALPLIDTLTAMLESSGFHDSLTVAGTVRDASARQTQSLLRIAQEGLTNAARHAPGAQVQVTLRYDARSVSLEVRNEPPARPAAQDVGSGLGLVGMRERVALLGGAIVAGPITEGPAAGGWRVEAEIPG
jgi:signal transduction histidine kinase